MCRKQQQQQNHSDSNWIKMLNQFLKPLFNLSETLSCPCSKLSLDLYICWGSYYRSIPTRDEYFTIEEHQQWGQEIFKPIKVDGSSLKSICIRQSQLLLWLLCCTAKIRCPKYENVLQHLVSGDENLWRFFIWLKLFSICEYGSFFAYYYTRQLND